MTVLDAPTQRKLPIFWTVIILGYLFMEWVYNQHLLHLLEYPSVTAAQFEWTEMFGKAIASVGLNLVLAKCYRRSGIVKFAIGVVLAYLALSWLFDKVIESFPDEFRHSSYYGAMHRKTVVEGNDDGRILTFTKEQAWYVRPLVLSQYYLALQDRQWTSIESKLRKPLDSKFDSVAKNKTKLWSQYDQAEEIRQYVDVGWQGYKEAMSTYARYENDPRYSKKAYDTFVSRVGSKPGLTRDQFIKARIPKYHAYLETILVEGNTQLRIDTIRGKDLPLRMDEKAFYRYLDNTARNIRTTVAPTTKEILDNAASKDAVALLVIPPISMGLSLLSISINLVALACAWISVLIRRKWVGQLVCGFFVASALGAVSLVYMTTSAVTQKDIYWAQLDASFELAHPVIWSAMSIPMRMEPYLCITAEPVGWIKEGMRRLYLAS